MKDSLSYIREQHKQMFVKKSVYVAFHIRDVNLARQRYQIKSYKVPIYILAGEVSYGKRKIA